MSNNNPNDTAVDVAYRAGLDVIGGAASTAADFVFGPRSEPASTPERRIADALEEIANRKPANRES